MTRSAQELLHELNASDESSRIEAKRSREVGKSLMETVTAFANEPGLGGGYLLLGVDCKIDAKGDAVYWFEGLPDPDKLQSDLAAQCATMLNVVIRPEMTLERIDEKTVLVVFVPEVDITQKPVYLKATGLPAGARRRIGSTDQRCTDEDLWVLRGASQPVQGPDMSIIPDARLDDFDPQAIVEYRRLRTLANPQAEELVYDNQDMLEALGALRRSDGELKPTIAGVVLFGKSMALRRLFPALRVDYVRIIGTQWVEDPENRFQSIDIRKPLMLALPQAEASIVDELPKGFRLPEGKLQSRQEPILPRKVIREALANAVMHRNYQIHSPIQIIRYSNRIEIINPGYSLKDMSDLGMPGSRLRNPAIAAVLHEVNWAETKGSGIRTMRRLSGDAGLTLPEFVSDRQKNEFKVTLFLHNLLTEEDFAWLKTLTGDTLSADEAKVLIYARETGAVDNTACRDFCGLDTLQASGVLRRLRDRNLLEKQGAGNRTHYILAIPGERTDPHPEQGKLMLEPLLGGGKLSGGGKLDDEGGKLAGEGGKLGYPDLPPDLATLLPKAGQRLSALALRQLIRALCRWRSMRGEELATLLVKDLKYLRNKHLTNMVQTGQLSLLYPESPNHPHQAYLTPGQDEEPDA
jgi:ATP-dependent DNA helicase RecG